jgi:hypothetical protein
LHLVRLDCLLLDEARQKVTLPDERPAEVLPVAGECVGLDSGQLEVVDAAEEPQRDVPFELPDQLVQQRLGRAAPGEPSING